ncbi:DUF1203 domain-containing protein [Breoghania sp. L-A4]|uniref:DUF1203 domain-containing protein n=1 Tax=Breoghania sp. L-A4 TaxID=2304600 RepID=UPI000E35E29D|nr:DUF1203 domain-containing protein [Breoghania sp. L-A4]AXS42514.1 DUF1203 domain-containing protein [Breoghania sp. L-A4]
MSDILIQAMPTETARAYQSGGLDANGQPPERHISDGSGVPCRHCLRGVPAGQDYLILAHRPFSMTQPYAEVGPIFLCAAPCERRADGTSLPEMYDSRGALILRGYGADERIVYGTGQVVPVPQITAVARNLLDDSRIAFVHARSSTNNCFQFRIERDVSGAIGITGL